MWYKLRGSGWMFPEVQGNYLPEAVRLTLPIDG